LGVGTTGLGYAAYRSYLMPSSMTKNLPAKSAQGTPAHPTATATTFMTPKGARAALTFTQHHQTVRVVTWSPNGTMLASGANDGFLFTWNLNDVVQLQIRPGDRVRALAWSPDGQQLAAGIGTRVVFFNALTGVKLYKHPRNSDAYFGSSDNLSMAEAGIPAHTLTVSFEYPDYHGLGDEWQKIDYNNMAKVDRMVAAALVMMANSAEPVHWNEQNPKAAAFIKASKERHP